MDQGLARIFGANKDKFLEYHQRHDTEVRDLLDRAKRVGQQIIERELDRLTFFGGDRPALVRAALKNTESQRAELDEELKEALIRARAEFEQRVNQLLDDLND